MKPALDFAKFVTFLVDIIAELRSKILGFNIFLIDLKINFLPYAFKVLLLHAQQKFDFEVKVK